MDESVLSTEALGQERARLALAAEEGEPGAADALLEIEALLREAELSQERRALARVAADRREREAVMELEAKRQQEATELLRTLAPRRLALARDLQDLLDTAAEVVVELQGVAAQMQVLGAVTGLTVPNRVDRNVARGVKQVFSRVIRNEFDWIPGEGRIIESLEASIVSGLMPTSEVTSDDTTGT